MHLIVRISTVVFFAASFGFSCRGTFDAPPENVLRVGVGAEVSDLDPQIVTGIPEAMVIGSLFEGLVGLDLATNEPIPGAAESWEVSADKLTYLFHLRSDGQWSNGDPVVAGDFLYSFKRMLSPRFGALYAYMLHCIRNGRAYNEGTLRDFDDVGVKALGDHTLEIKLEYPAPYFLAMQAHLAWFPVHPASVDAAGGTDTRGTPWTRPASHVSNGPFRLEEWRPNEIVKVVRNERYWDREGVRLDGIDFYPIDDVAVEERAFRTGKLDWTYMVPMYKVDTYKQEEPEFLQIEPILATVYCAMNTVRSPLDNMHLRRALSLALDREEITRNVCKLGEQPAWSFVPPGIKGYEAPPGLTYGPEEARAVLARAGYPGGKGLPPIEIIYPSLGDAKRTVEVAQHMWKETLGIEVTILKQDWKVFLDNVNKRDFDVAVFGWTGDIADPINFLEIWTSDNGNNPSGYRNEAFDQLIGQAYAEADPARRMNVLKEAEAIFLEELPGVPIFFDQRGFLRRPEVKGCVSNALIYRRYQDIYLERAKS